MRRMQVFAIVTVALFLAACDPIVYQRGHVDEALTLDSITVGETTRDEVRRKLGSPSVTSNYGNETWYYIQSRKEAKAFFRPEITDQQVVQLSFDGNGVVTDIKHYDKAHSEQVAIVEKVTPTEGHSLSFFEQLMGNVGRFNKGRDVTTSPNRRR